MEEKILKRQEEYTLDGSVDRHGRPAIRSKTGTWAAGILLLGKLYSQNVHHLKYLFKIVSFFKNVN